MKELIVQQIVVFHVLFYGSAAVLSVVLWKRFSQKWFRSVMRFCWICLFFGHFLEPYRLVNREFNISIEGVPSQTIAVVSDFHVRQGKGTAFVERVVDRLNELENIDYIVIPGDFLYGHPDDVLEALQPLENIIKPTYFTLGNHDHELVGKELEGSITGEYLKSLGLIDLNNASHAFKDRWVSGLDDNYTHHDHFHDIESGKEDILVVHSPDIVDYIPEQYDPKLIITGHTHCGQIRVPWYGAMPGIIPTKNGKKYERHLYEYKPNRWLFVSCGVGEVGPIARFFNPPEVVVLRINN